MLFITIMAGKDQGKGKGKGKGKDQGRAGNAEKKRDKIEPNKPAPKKFTGPDPVPVWEGDSPSKIEGDAWREAVLAGAVNAMKSVRPKRFHSSASLIANSTPRPQYQEAPAQVRETAEPNVLTHVNSLTHSTGARSRTSPPPTQTIWTPWSLRTASMPTET